MVSRLKSLMIALVTAGTLSACGNDFQAAPFDARSKDLTGVQNKDGLPYTGASDSADLEILKQAIDPSAKTNLGFAASIVSVAVLRLDLAGNPVAVAPGKLQIRIQYQGAAKPTSYAPVLNSAHAATAVVSTDDAGATKLNVRCLDPDCASVEIRISSGSSEAGLIYRLRKVTIEALGPFSSGSSTTHLERVGTLASGAATPVLMTTEVAWGPAMFALQAGDVQASGDLVATGGDEENVSVQIKNETPIEGRLIGNNNHGDLLLRFADQSAWSFLRIRLPVDPNASAGSGGSSGADGSDTAPAPPDDTPTSERFVPFDTNHPITAAFQRDKNKAAVQAEITVDTTGKRSGDMRQFLNRAQPNLQAMVRDLQTQGVPPEFVFITFVESHYFYSDYDVSVSSAEAVGPWQLMLKTAEGLGLKVFEPTILSTYLVKGKSFYKYRAKPCDERGDLHLSTMAAAKYLRNLLNTFRTDPKLAVMAYNMGAGGMNRRLNCINEKKKGATDCDRSAKPLIAEDLAGLDYWTVRDLKAAPQESIDYVPRFLAAQFVGREPSRYGFTVDSTGVAPAPTIAACK